MSRLSLCGLFLGSALLLSACADNSPAPVPAPGGPGAAGTPTPPGGQAGVPSGRPAGMGPGMMGPGGGMGMGGPPGAAAAPKFEDSPIALTDGKADLNGGNTSVGFVGYKANGKHDGGFRTLTGSVELTPDGASIAKIEVNIDMESIWSDNGGLTNHLKNADFFDTKQHASASFATTAIAAADGGDATHTLTGDLTLHGVTKSVSVPAKVTLADGKLSVKCSFQINRQDFGMNFDASRVNNEVDITVAIGVAAQ